ncbi:MAG: DUF1622 domain-containing protein [Clostridia bacterium]|nr:DUF1622 domain-containing protein [Clostridia bacterium]
MLENFAVLFKDFLFPVAEITASTLELIGIIIIFIGSFRALFRVIGCLIKKQPLNIVIELGKALALALEFKMGAEIIKTVIIHDLEELAILGVVIIIRALLAVIIHWEIRLEKKENTEEKESDK